MDYSDETEHKPRLGYRLERILDKAETIYLKLLRAILLLIATGLIIYAGLLAVGAIYKIMQSPDSVVEEVATVQPQELTSAQLPNAQTRRNNAEPSATAEQRRAYRDLLARYFQIYRSKFEPFKQEEDRALSRADFDARFLETQSRLSAVAEGRLDYQQDVTDLAALVQTMAQASELPETQRRLRLYRQARKVQACRNVESTRTTYVEGWDAYSMSCPNWYEDMGCSVRRAVQTPYTDRQCSMQFPEGTQTHQQIFRAYQDQFYSLLTSRREANRADAQAERLSIIDGISEGKLNLWTALLVAGGFLVLMFFFLLIAIERHQRRASASLTAD